MTNTRSTITVDPEAVAKAPQVEKGVVLMSHPKIVFMYPSWFVSILAGFYLYFFGHEADPTRFSIDVASGLGWTFLIVFSLNLVVLAFDFPRSTSLLLFAVIAALVLGAFLLIDFQPNLLPAVHQWINSMHPVANSTFYLLFATVMGLIFLTVAITSRFDYWEVRPNELLHHHGVLSDLERFSSPNLRIDKEINDIFEFVLLRSGRLILHPSQERKAIVLDNIFFINRKEEAITKLLGALQVQVREPGA
ncbi:hypothetical protein [Planctomicrobium piriforme]|uniref:Uncharacterized protein n=1 Tax=Planctomicrobium piriforme TaxID=1576369 RepID=A0A1I3LVA0_9PLAN|nr:hypothetical protein [Planctomicrobium piriforme]SFI88480.1 hypothetical protein SAMN05421753_11371 [Planctomicrobium piriforme]